MKQIINTSGAPKPIGPYNQAVLNNNTLFISGQICIDPTTGNLVNTDVKAETNQVMKNIQAILKEAGMDFNNVCKCSIFIKNMDDFSKINEVYGSYFINDYPARETVEVAKLPLNVNVEISVIAIK